MNVSKSVGLRGALLASLLLGAVPLHAQTPAPAGQSAAASPVVAGWNDGFFVQSANGDYRLSIGVLAQIDGRFSLDDPKPITNTFLLRRMRPIFSGRVAKYFDYRIMPDFGNGTAIVQDAYLDIRFSPKFRIRSGKDKTPIGYEVLIVAANLFLPERSLASSLVPLRDIGVQAQGDLAAGRLSYSVGVFNGIPDASTSTADVDANSAKDVAGKIVLQPFRSAATPARPLNGLGFHLGASSGEESGTLPAFKTSVGQTYFSYAPGAAASGTRRRVSPAVFYYYKTFGAFAEYVRSTQAITKSAAQTDVTNQAWDVTGTIVLTGEAASAGGVRPKANFDPATGQHGAFQVSVRYSALEVGQTAFDAGLPAPGASREARSFAVGVNWFPAPFIKYAVAYERTSFSNSDVRSNEHAILFRTQVAF